MRNNGIFVILALAFVITISAVGDEEDLTPSLDLAVEPISVPIEPNISTAAFRNDFITFDSLYRQADAGGENVTRWSELHRFWTWSMTDPVGGFYGQETHDRFARQHPGYAAFIEDSRIVDENGVAFYPSSETRKYLLQNVGEVPVRIAAEDRRPRLSPPVKVTSPAKAQIAVRKPAPIVTKVDVVHTGQAGAPVLHSVVVPAPVPVAIAAAAPTPTPVPRPATRPGVGRGIFLIIVGLIGIGVVSVMLHASGDEPHTISHS